MLLFASGDELTVTTTSTGRGLAMFHRGSDVVAVSSGLMLHWGSCGLSPAYAENADRGLGGQLLIPH